ncbi:hypothetical protein J6590_068108 [Homalodisca vitripennis]|nr:hypothetical protein J6590_068108 [Homalodisca vitripennis]
MNDGDVNFLDEVDFFSGSKAGERRARGVEVPTEGRKIPPINGQPLLPAPALLTFTRKRRVYLALDTDLPPGNFLRYSYTWEYGSNVAFIQPSFYLWSITIVISKTSVILKQPTYGLLISSAVLGL